VHTSTYLRETVNTRFRNVPIQPSPSDDIVVMPVENGFRASRKAEPLRQFFGRSESDARANLAAAVARWDMLYRAIAERKAGGSW